MFSIQAILEKTKIESRCLLSLTLIQRTIPFFLLFVLSLTTQTLHSEELSSKKGAIRIIDLNNTINPEVVDDRFPKILEVESGLINIGFNYDIGAEPWIFEKGKDLPHYIADSLSEFTSRASPSRSYKLNNSQIVYQQNSSPYSYWITDGSPSATKEWDVIKKLQLKYPHTVNKTLYWASQLSNGSIVFVLDGLWSYEPQNEKFISLSEHFSLNVKAISTDGDRLYFQNDYRGDIYQTDGSIEGTNKILSFENSDNAFVNGGFTNGTYYSIHQDSGHHDSYFVEVRNSAENLNILKHISDGTEKTIYEGSNKVPDITLGILENSKSIFFVASNDIYRYDKVSSNVEQIKAPEEIINIDKTKLHKIVNGKILVEFVIDEQRQSPSYFYTFNISSENFEDVSNSNDLRYVRPHVVAANENSVYILSRVITDSYVRLIKYSAQHEKLEILSHDTPWDASATYFTREDQLFIFSQADEQSILDGLYRYDERINSFKLAFMPKKDNITLGSYIPQKTITNYKENIYFEGHKSIYIPRYNGVDIKNQYAFWSFNNGEPELIIEGRLNSDRNAIVSADKLYFDIRTEEYSEAIYSYEPEKGLELIYTANKNTIPELFGYTNGKLLVSTNDSHYAYLSTETGQLTQLEYDPESHYEDLYKCDAKLFIHNNNKLWLIGEESITEVPNINIRQVISETTASQLVYIDDNAIKSFNCDNHITETLFNLPNSQFPDYKEITENIFYISLYQYINGTYTNVLYEINSTTKESRLLNSNLEMDIHSWTVTQEGIYAIKSNGSIFKFIDNDFQLVFSDESLNSLVAYISEDDPLGWIFLSYNRSNSVQKGMLVYIPSENNVYNVDFTNHGYFSQFNELNFIGGKYYMSYDHPKFGSEMAEIDQMCFMELVVQNSTCSNPIENQAPVIADINETNWSPGDSIYIPVRALDADLDKLTYELDNNPSWLEINSLGEITGKVANSAQQTYDIQVAIDDGTAKKYSNRFKLNIRETQSSINSNTDSEKSSSSGGSASYYLLVLLSLALVFMKNKEKIANRALNNS